ncbi:MAG: NADH-quinone oxidoreductase subunit L, partial [Gemmataceae bacterium]|nr:NADH-quinone oxidoreductase subunit L [Gemmataceae bacterium]
WIAIFSKGYMHGEPGYARYFAVMSLFLFSMTGLVLADNFLVLYAFWEGVGLCSYLLIGFWFHKPAAAAAARKAFLVTRLGDAGMILGIMLLWAKFGHAFDFQTIFFNAGRNPDSPYLLAACLLLFCGAIGKSAQFPLHVWLPDAMEGPTPASALIHAATMVTAGVYLVARCTPLFILAPEAQLVVCVIGGVTALLAALIALTQTDLKRVLAYSTVSQLGFMFMGLGAGLRTEQIAVFAVSAAIFHLFTHAFFKALLFLGAGSVMHAMGHVIDMRRFSGLRRVMPITHVTFLCGAAALAGLIPFSGFWSKDQILESLEKAVKHAELYASVYHTLFALAIVTAGITAFYTFRAYFKTFWGETRVPVEALHHHDSHGPAGDHGHADGHGHVGDHGPAGDHGHPENHGHPDGHGHVGDRGYPEDRHGDGGHLSADHHGHGDPTAESHEPASIVPEAGRSFESPGVMTFPLVILAAGAAFVGLVFEALTHWFSKFLAMSIAFAPFPGEAPEHHLNWGLIALSTLSAVLGIGLAAVFYVLRPEIPEKLASTARWAYDLSYHRFRFDELYQALIVKPLEGLAVVSRFVDSIIDGLVDLIGSIPKGMGYLIRPIQNGLVQFYGLFMVVFMTALMAMVVFWVRQ